MSNENKKNERILLVLLPFWTPLSPPLGITCLKDFLKKKGFEVKAVDTNAEEELRQYSNRYFDALNQYIPENKKGNFYSIGNEVLRNHLMAHINHNDDKGYRELVRILIEKTFFIAIDDSTSMELIKIIDEFYCRLETYFLQLLESEKPDVLGLSTYSDTLAASVFCFRLARERYPDMKTVMGGGVFADLLAPGSPNLDFFLERTEGIIDKLVIGEGEHLFHHLLRKNELDKNWWAESKRVFSLEDINHKLLDISSVDPLDFSDFKLTSYPYLVSYTSRSCPFQCSFCSETLQWGKYRKKSARQIVRELKELSRLHHCQLFLLGDSLLNPVIMDLAEELNRIKESIYWEGWLRVSDQAVDTDNTLKWRRCGFYHARLGIESGSPRILELMEKKISPQQVKQTLFSLSLAGIKTTTLWIVGFPGETEEDFQQTLDLIEESKDHIYEAEGTPFWYYLTGQPNSGQWREQDSVLLYPQGASDMLMVQTWILTGEPSREETYDRLNRFARHLEKLGIPNTYSLHDIYNADERWKKLHKNAVPSLMEFTDNTGFINEKERVKKLSIIRDTQLEDQGFGF